jgi:hypothetical protein
MDKTKIGTGGNPVAGSRLTHKPSWFERNGFSANFRANHDAATPMTTKSNRDSTDYEIQKLSNLCNLRHLCL